MWGLSRETKDLCEVATQLQLKKRCKSLRWILEEKIRRVGKCQLRKLKQWALGKSSQKKTIKIGSKIEVGLTERLVNCLQAYTDVFAKLHDNMPRIDPWLLVIS